MSERADVWYNAMEDELFLLGPRDYIIHDFILLMDKVFHYFGKESPVVYVGRL